MVVVMGRKNSIYPLKNSTEINLDDNNQLKMPIEMNEGTQKEMGANQTMTNILETKMMCFFFSLLHTSKTENKLPLHRCSFH